MSSEETAILAALVVLEVKHFLFDFVLQRPYSFFRNKGIYGHPGGIVHAGLHVLGTSAVFLVVPVPFLSGAAIIAGEFFVHYHIDWTKEEIDRRWELNPANKILVLGADQLLHQLTYIGILAVLISGYVAV